MSGEELADTLKGEWNARVLVRKTKRDLVSERMLIMVVVEWVQMGIELEWAPFWGTPLERGMITWMDHTPR